MDKKSISVTFTDHQGLLKSLSMPYSVEHLVNHVRKHYGDKKVAFAYEAGPTGYGLYDGLEAQAYTLLDRFSVDDSQSARTTSEDQSARQSRDSENLRGGQLKSIHVPTPLYRELRHLTQLRDTLVSEMVAMKQRIKSLLLMEGLEFPRLRPAASGRFWSKTKLRKLPCSSVVRFKLDRLLDSLEFDEKQVLKATREIRRFCQNDPELSQCIEYLKTLPGIGWIVASQLLARVGDWRQIKNIRQLPAFLGLVPTENSTGERTDRGSITHSGDRRLRSKLIQASWSAIRQDGELREFFRTVAKKHPRHLRCSGRHCGGGSQTLCAGLGGVDETKTLRGQTKSSIGSFDPRGDCAPGNDSTTASTRRKQLLKVRSLRQRARGVVPLRGAHPKSV